MAKLRAEGIDTLVPALSSGGKDWLARTRPVALLGRLACCRSLPAIVARAYIAQVLCFLGPDRRDRRRVARRGVQEGAEGPCGACPGAPPWRKRAPAPGGRREQRRHLLPFPG